MTLCCQYHSQGKVILYVASSDIAFLLLPEGSTAHFWFNISLNCTFTSTYQIFTQFSLAVLLCTVSLIIWDEALIQHKFNLTAINTILCDIQQNESLFSGIPVVFSGDFAQTLPMINHGVQADQVAVCMQQTLWWQNLIILILTENMRLYTSIVNTTWGQWIAKMSYDPLFYRLITLSSILNQQFTAISVFLQYVYCLENLQQASKNPEYFRN